MGKLFTDEQMYREFNALLDVRRERRRRHQSGAGDARKAHDGRRAYRQLYASLADLNEMTRRIKAGEGSLGSC